MPDLRCWTCGERPVRDLADPIPVDAAVSRAEWFTGRALYCLECFVKLDDPEGKIPE